MNALAIPLLSLTLLLGGCSTPLPKTPLRGHITQAPTPPIAHPVAQPGGQIPPLVEHLSAAPAAQTSSAAQGRPGHEKFSVTVHSVPVRDLLFALARDAKMDVDIAPGITGQVTLNAVDQPLPALLERIARQVPLRFEFTADSLLILPDTPYLKHYPVDYVNLARTVNGAVSNNMQIGGMAGSVGNSAGAASSASSVGAGSLSNTRIENTTQHRFWENLEKNLRLLLVDREIRPNIAVDSPESPKIPAPTANTPSSTNTPSTAPSSSSTLIVNPEAGLVSVVATRQQHLGIQAFIDRISQAVRRQVLIEATIVEVALGEGHEQGIDWNGLVRGGVLEFAGNSLKNTVNLRYSRDDNPRALISLLATFGTSRVLSSPRISVLNNQSALLKVVENYVYFTVRADTTTTANVGTTVTYSTTPQTVSVGLVLGVTPQISADDSVVLNIRPTITSIGREVPDPNPDLRKNGIENLVPMIRTREIESVMRVSNGQIAILGGLMEDRIIQRNNRLPGLGDLPLAGELFTNRNNQAQKTELVIFLRPVVIREASLRGDFARFTDHLPSPTFFQPDAIPTAGTPGAEN